MESVLPPYSNSITHREYLDLQDYKVPRHDIIPGYVLGLVFESSTSPTGYCEMNVLISAARAGRRRTTVAYYHDNPSTVQPSFAQLGSDSFMLWTRKERSGFFTAPHIDNPDNLDWIDRIALST